jgi:putative ABC transport system permease protein
MHLFQNNLLMAFRTIWKDKLFSAINIFGLTISMAACLLIFQYAFFELNYDRFHPNAGRTYRMYASTYRNGELNFESAITPTYLAPILKEKIAEVAQTARLVSTRWWFDCTLAYYHNNDYRIFNERDLYYADPSVFSLFAYPLLKGDVQTALAQPHSIVLSTQVAEKYFGTADPMGKILRLKGSGEDHDYTVTGIMDHPPANSHLAPTIFASISTLEPNPDFKNQNAYTYIQLHDPSGMESVQAKIDRLVAEVVPPANGFRTQLNWQALTDIHLQSHLQDDMKAAGNAKSVYFLLAIAVSILIMAWINYFNLTTARSFTRAKEVGIRKISGASRRQIGFQFLTETLVYNITAILCAAYVAYLMAPAFYSFVGVNLPPHFLLVGQGVAGSYFMLIIFLGGIFISGIFPALTLSSFKPIHVLKGKYFFRSTGFSPRKITVVFQFACAFMLAMAVMTFNRQFQFMRSQDLQVEISKVLIVKSPVNVDSTYLQRLAAFKNQLTNLAAINAISSSSAVPGTAIGWTGTVRNEKEENGYNFTINVTDPDFINTYQLKLLAGRPFETTDFPLEKFGDKLEPVMINRTGLTQLGHQKPEDAIGTFIFWEDNKCIVVGVVDDFHQESLKKTIQPQLFTANRGPTLSLRVTKGDQDDWTDVIAQIHLAWNTHFPNNPFDYAILENQFNEQYAADEQVAKVFNFFCVLALIVSCLGLFALSLFSVQQRTKEISIRKVLGAPSMHLLQLLLREYVLLILIASVLAMPIAFWGINQWLQTFAFHIQPGITIFILPTILVVVLALLTISAHTLKVITENPTDNLKHE